MTTRSALGVWTLALLMFAGAFATVVTSDFTTDKVATIAIAGPIGLVFVLSGLIARGRRPENRTGSLLVATGLTWFLGALSSADEPVLFTAGLLLGTLSSGVLAHLLLAYPTGRLDTRFDRRLVRAAYVLVLAGPALIALVDRDVEGCGDRACPENLVAVTENDALMNVFRLVFIVVAVTLLGLLIARLVRRWRRGSPALRRALAPVYFTGLGFTAVLAVLTTVAAFSSELAERLNWVTLAALLSVPLAFLFGLLRPRFSAATRQLVAELSAKRHPGEIQDVLRRVLHDPSLLLGHRMVPGDGYVDVHGAPLDLPTSDDARAVTTVGEGAVLVHDAALRDQPELDEVLDATNIALERGVSLRSLEASERRAGALLAAIPDNVYRVAEDGTFLEARANKSSAIFPPGIVYPGVPEASIVGKRVHDVMPEIAHHIMRGVDTALRTDTTPTVEFAIETPKGTRDLELRVARSGPAETVGIVRDVTDRKRQERELRRLVDEQAALSRVALAVATDPGAERVFEVVIEELGLLLDADAASLVRFHARDDIATIVGRWDRHGRDVGEPGPTVELDGGPLTRVRATRRAARGGVDDPEISPRLAERLRAAEISALVAAPIEVSGELWGAVVLSLTGDQSFASDAEERIGQFANLVAVALANAEARRELATLAEEQSALSRVAVAVATEEEPEQIFNLVTEEAARLLGARWGSTVRYEEDERVVVVGDWHLGDDRELELGARFPLQGGAITQAKQTGRPARLQYVLGPDPNPREMIAAPIVVSGQIWGATTISMPAPDTFPPDAEERLGKFTRLVAVALANAEAHEQLRASRARIVQAGDAERRRLERNLHDGAQQRLVSLALGLRLAQAKLPDDPVAARELLERASEELAIGLEELRELARGIHPAILSDRGLTPALEALADRAAVPVELNGLPSTRLPEAIEAAAFYVVAESLTNVAKYAAASSARVDLARNDGFLVVEVSDDGVGGADAAKGSGLRGLSDRVEALGGRLHVASEPGRGTTVRAELPVSSD